MSNVYEFTVKTIDGVPKSLADYKGSVLLIVNVASRCGLTPQYEALEALHQRFASLGLRVLGFPANDFGAQEPGTESEIKTFCSTNYGVTFEMFTKLSVKGSTIDPLYAFLQRGEHGKSAEVKWNFHKFLIGRDGQVLGAFASTMTPDSAELVSAIEAALAKSP